MKKAFWFMVAVLSITAILLTFTRPDIIVGGLPKAHAVEYKLDQTCTGTETIGRCADKCPNQSDTLEGFNPDGTAVCRAAPKLAPNGDLTTPPTNPVPEPIIDDGFVGK